MSTTSDLRTVGKVAAVTAAVGALGGYAAAAWIGSAHVSQMLPWILGRGLGIAAYLALTALTAFGLWLRHPWRVRWPHPTPGVQLRVHAALAALTGVLVIGHVVALVLDRYAGVGWGAVVPGAASYRPFAVALGTAALYGGLLVGGTAALAGRLFGRAWRPVHRIALVVFGMTWMHGLLAGSDTPQLRVMYVVSGFVVLGLWMSRRLARPVTAMVTRSAT